MIISKEDLFPFLRLWIQGDPGASTTMLPTLEIAPTAAAPAFPVGTPLATAIGMTQIYTGPGEDYDKLALLEPGEQAVIIGVNEDESWWAIRLPYLESGRGWVMAERVLAENTLDVRVVSGEETLGVGEQPTGTARALANINIRSGPGLEYPKVGGLEVDQEVKILGVDADGFWFLIEAPGTSQNQGWISVDYVVAQNADAVPVVAYQPVNANTDVPTPAPDDPALTATAVVNIRSGPDTNYQILGKLQLGQRAEVVGVHADGRWYAIKYTPGENGRAWVAADYVLTEQVEGAPVLP